VGDKTGIEWTEATWNPTTGCDRVSPGCDHCYALTLAGRLKAMGASAYQEDGDPRTSGPGFKLTVHPDRLDVPLRWTRPRFIFVNSMSDLFHKDVPDEFIAKVFAVMALAPRHTFQVLTKRHGRMRSLLSSGRFADLVVAALSTVVDETSGRLPAKDFDAAYAHVTDRVHVDEPMPPLPNVWLGVSVEDQKRADLRIPALLATPAAVRFLSCEPILGPVSFRWAKWAPLINAGHLDGLRGIDWVIVGGESGPGHRPIDPEWVRSLRDQCSDAGVAFLFKQWGGATPKAGGRELDGVTHDGYPGAVSA